MVVGRFDLVAKILLSLVYLRVFSQYKVLFIFEVVSRGNFYILCYLHISGHFHTSWVVYLSLKGKVRERR